MTSAATENEGKKRGGQRGERPWRDKPTPRERVLTQNLADYVKSETGRDVSSETVRAIRYCLPKWNTAPETKALREFKMARKLEKAKLQDKREKALAMLKEAESELGKFSGEADLDDEDDSDENESESDEYSDDSEDDDDDIFSDSGKVTASF